MPLMNDFIQILTSNVDVFTKWIEETHNVPGDVVITKWNDLTGMNLVKTDDDTVICEDEISSEISIQRPGTLIPHLCQHVFKIGSRAGQQCSKKPKGNAVKCCSHKNQDDKIEKETKKVKETPKKTETKKVKEKAETKKVTPKKVTPKKVTPKKVTKKVKETPKSSNESDSEVQSTKKKVTKRKVKESPPKEKNLSDSSDSDFDPHKTESDDDD